MRITFCRSVVQIQDETLTQPSPQAFSARSFLDSTISCDVTETSRGQRINRERLGTRLTITQALAKSGKIMLAVWWSCLSSINRPFLGGVHELASFILLSPKKKNNNNNNNNPYSCWKKMSEMFHWCEVCLSLSFHSLSPQTSNVFFTDCLRIHAAAASALKFPGQFLPQYVVQARFSLLWNQTIPV